jgi:hypothetical protein
MGARSVLASDRKVVARMLGAGGAAPERERQRAQQRRSQRLEAHGFFPERCDLEIGCDMHRGSSMQCPCAGFRGRPRQLMALSLATGAGGPANIQPAGALLATLRYRDGAIGILPTADGVRAEMRASHRVLSLSTVRWRVVLRAAAIGVCVLAMAYVVGLASLQRRLLFARPSVRDAPPRPPRAQQVWLSPASGPVEAWYLPPSTADAPRAPLLIFFHGNAELIDFQPQDFSEPCEWGMAVLLVEFPGYGRSSGEPSENSLAAAAVAAHDWATTQPAAHPARIVAPAGRPRPRVHVYQRAKLCP